MKHIGIDVRLLFQTGVGTYLQNLIHHLPTYTPRDIMYTFYCLPQDEPFIKTHIPQARIHTTTALWHSLREQTEFLFQIQSDNLNLMHFTYFGHPILYKGKSISTIHDVTPLLFATGKASTKNSMIYALKRWAFAQALNNQAIHSSAIITPTHSVKQQLIRIYGEQVGKKITPLYEGVSYRLTETHNDAVLVNEPYLLYVGNFYPHKNVLSLVKAFSRNTSQYHLVLAGPHDYFLTRLLDSLSDAEKKRIIVKDKPKLAELVSLYRHAEALVHPSISEGFGLPLVEAMHFGIPIVASHIPVFQEILGESHYSFDPYDVDSIAEALRTFESAPEKKKNTLSGDFSFATMTKRTVELYATHVS